MSIIVYVIRDHYAVFHDCNTEGQGIELLVGNNPRPPDHFKFLLYSSCGEIYEYYAGKDINLQCKDCGKKYVLGEREKEPAIKSWEEFLEKVKIHEQKSNNISK